MGSSSRWGLIAAIGSDGEHRGVDLALGAVPADNCTTAASHGGDGPQQADQRIAPEQVKIAAADERVVRRRRQPIDLHAEAVTERCRQRCLGDADGGGSTPCGSTAAFERELAVDFRDRRQTLGSGRLGNDGNATRSIEAMMANIKGDIGVSLR
jgi:hypothetical protein